MTLGLTEDDTITGADWTVTPATPPLVSAPCSEEAEARMPEDSVDRVDEAATESATAMAMVTKTDAGAMIRVTLLASTPAALAKTLFMASCLAVS